LLRLKAGDPRAGLPRLSEGDSIPLHLWTADDTNAALVARRSINGRTAAVNRRRIEAAVTEGPSIANVELIPEKAGDATVRAFKITLGMIAKAAMRSGHVDRDPMAGSGAYAPKPKAAQRRARLVSTLDELFDVADAISELGPLMDDGRPQGARFRALVLVGGTTGPRPGELAAHRPEWIDWHLVPSEFRFHKTEVAVYGAILTPDEKGLRERGLKHRRDDDFRSVPLISDVRAALLEHVERGYSSSQRTWLSRTGRGHVDFGNLMENFWRPAFERVFAGTDKAGLATSSAGILRKTAITLWADSGITATQAAEWAGHSEEVARIYYASRASTTFAREVALLEDARNSGKGV
jgi:integrase